MHQFHCRKQAITPRAALFLALIIILSFAKQSYAQAQGACCVFPGDCVETSSEDCTDSQGQFVGVGTVCSEDTCSPMGACCFGDDGCEIRTEQDCNASGFTYEDGALCEDAECAGNEGVNLPGACCVTGETCEFLTQQDCNDLPGSFRGEGVPCDDDVCANLLGACCLPLERGGECLSDVTEEQCDAEDSDSSFMGRGTSCDDINCDEEVGEQPGACCAESGECTIEFRDDCVGTFMGENTFCEGRDCNEPTGACCTHNGTCEVIAISDCSNPAVTFFGIDVACESIDCTDHQRNNEFCCLENSCVLVNSDDTCRAIGGSPSSCCELCFGSDCDLEDDGPALCTGPVLMVGSLCFFAFQLVRRRYYLPVESADS